MKSKNAARKEKHVGVSVLMSTGLMLAGMPVIGSLTVGDLTGHVVRVPSMNAKDASTYYEAFQKSFAGLAGTFEAHQRMLEGAVKEMACTREDEEQSSYEFTARSASSHMTMLSTISRSHIIRAIMADAKLQFGESSVVEHDVMWRSRGTLINAMSHPDFKCWVESIVPVRPESDWKSYLASTKTGDFQIVPFRPDRCELEGEYIMFLVKKQSAQAVDAA